MLNYLSKNNFCPIFEAKLSNKAYRWAINIENPTEARLNKTGTIFYMKRSSFLPTIYAVSDIFGSQTCRKQYNRCNNVKIRFYCYCLL